MVPLSCFISENGHAKLEIGIAKGKKAFDKRESIKKKDNAREDDRYLKDY
jgi:SsrA-binding protein